MRVEKALQSAIKTPNGLLALVTLTYGCVYSLISLLRYRLVPTHSAVLLLTGLAITGLCIGLGVKYRKIQSTASTVLSALLPLITLFCMVAKSLAWSENTVFYRLHFLITLIVSIVLFFIYVKEIILKVILGILYTLLFFLTTAVVLLALLFGDFSSTTVTASVPSPHDKYAAQIVVIDQGALGGSTLVNVVRLNRDVNLPLARLEKQPRTLYSGRWGESGSLQLRWENDEWLYINDRRYAVSPRVTRQYGLLAACKASPVNTQAHSGYLHP